MHNIDGQTGCWDVDLKKDQLDGTFQMEWQPQYF